MSAAPASGGAVTCTNASGAGDVGSSGSSASVVQTGCAITGSVIAPVSPQVVSDFNSAFDQYAAIPCTGSLETAYTGAALVAMTARKTMGMTTTKIMTLSRPIRLDGELFNMIGATWLHRCA